MLDPTLQALRSKQAFPHRLCGMQQSYAAKFFLANKADFCIL